MVQIVWIRAGRLRLFFLVRPDGADMSNTRSALFSKPRQEIFVKTGTLGVPTTKSCELVRSPIRDDGLHTRSSHQLLARLHTRSTNPLRSCLAQSVRRHAPERARAARRLPARRRSPLAYLPLAARRSPARPLACLLLTDRQSPARCLPARRSPLAACPPARSPFAACPLAACLLAACLFAAHCYPLARAPARPSLLVACPLAVSRSPPAAHRLPLAACRSPLAACRLPAYTSSPRHDSYGIVTDV